jgi:hypothetical protein
LKEVGYLIYGFKNTSLQISLNIPNSNPCGHPFIVSWNVSRHLPSKNNPVDKIDLFVSTGLSSGLQIDPIYHTVDTGPASEMA